VISLKLGIAIPMLAEMHQIVGQQQLELTRDSLSTVQQECSRLRDELVAAGVAAQLVEQERSRLLAQAFKDSEAARESAAPHLPLAVESELAHLRQAITETLGEQALLRLLPRPRRGTTSAYTSEGRGLDYSSAMTAAYAASGPRVSITTSSPAVSVADTPIHPSWVEGRRPTGMESPARAVAIFSQTRGRLLSWRLMPLRRIPLGRWHPTALRLHSLP